MPSDRRADFGRTRSRPRAALIGSASAAYGDCMLWEVSPSGADIYVALYTLDSAVPHTPPQGAGGQLPFSTMQFKNTRGGRGSGTHTDGTQYRSLSSSQLSPDLVSWIVFLAWPKSLVMRN